MPRTYYLLLMLTAASALATDRLAAQDAKDGVVPAAAKLVKPLSNNRVDAFRDHHTLWLALDKSAVAQGKATIPRLCAPIRSIRWADDSTTPLKFVPEPKEWVFSWKKSPPGDAVIEVVMDGDPMLPEERQPVAPAGDGSVMLHAHYASTFGEKLRYEPQWYKNTVGYWTIPTDYASWDLTIDQPGTFTVAVLQGCGKGQGGSDALITLRQREKIAAELPFQTIDTGHFQNFRWNHLGKIEVSGAGDYELRIAPKRIAKNALFDVRAIHLVRQAAPSN